RRRIRCGACGSESTLFPLCLEASEQRRRRRLGTGWDAGDRSRPKPGSQTGRDPWVRRFDVWWVPGWWEADGPSAYTPGLWLGLDNARFRAAATAASRDTGAATGAMDSGAADGRRD